VLDVYELWVEGWAPPRREALMHLFSCFSFDKLAPASNQSFGLARESSPNSTHAQLRARKLTDLDRAQSRISTEQRFCVLEAVCTHPT
jgi:hypothetical protein